MRIVPVALLLLLLVGCGHQGRSDDRGGRGVVSNTHELRHASGRNVRQILARGDYDRLEQIAAELRSSRATAADGAALLRYFYKDGFDDPALRGTSAFPALIEHLQAWCTARPNSITAPVALAYAHIGYAWEARTGQYASQVRQEQWRQFSSRLDQAAKVLQGAGQLPERCPCWYLAVQNLALGQGWERAAYESLFAQATRAEPEFDAYYELKASYLQPRWHGAPGEWQRFALESAQVLPDSLGARRYARIVWALFISHRGLIHDEKVDWALARRGFEVLLKEHPRSLETLSVACFLACQAEDRETARRLFAQIGPRIDLDTWVDPRMFLQSRAWAMQGPST